jgi:hypothetical protein
VAGRQHGRRFSGCDRLVCIFGCHYRSLCWPFSSGFGFVTLAR